MASPAAVTGTPAQTQAQTGAPQDRLNQSEIRAIVYGLMTAMLLAALDQTIVATAMPTIGLDLGDAANLPWIVTAYLLASTAVTPLYGKLSDIHGRRIMLLIAIATFGLGSLACALAPTMVTLALARGLQGIGGGGLIALSQTILADIMSPKERARYQVVIAGVFVAASVAGPLLGGLFAQHLHWSLIFWINLPIGILAFALTNANLKRLPRHDRQHRLDWPGAALMVAGSVTLLLALSWGGVRYPWGSPTILALLAGAAVLAGGFAARLATASEPLIPTEVLKDRVVYSATLAACFAMGTFIGLTIYVPIFLEGVIGLSASESGVALVPLMIGTVTGATLSGRSMLHFRHYKRVPLAMMSLSLACCATIAWEGRALPFWLMEVLFALLSMGIGTILPLSTIAIQNAVEPHQLGIATAAMNFFRSLGGALIVAAFGTIVLGGVAGGAGSGTGGHDVESLIRGADPAQLALTFRFVFMAACLGLLGAFTFLALMEERPLRERASPRMGGEPATGDPG
ncbi:MULTISPECIES: MDR family MFS transporter [unclassified Methylobacterium]|uniref:MDR family MFS transporter n=1 Tax=unclassified Methylobacterium TaxID=2615210 RepID=UPI0005B89D2D|nr:MULTISPECIES: MDR family MFS transporter [unclassified Methylobacterium]SFV01794.1 drug resistance transporter, EmrB/QacA subfamily [Methylobacterium sp. UNCCL125]